MFGASVAAGRSPTVLRVPLHHARAAADPEPARRASPRPQAQQRGSISSGDRIEVEAGVLYALIDHRQDDRDAGHDARDAFTGGTGHLPF